MTRSQPTQQRQLCDKKKKWIHSIRPTLPCIIRKTKRFAIPERAVYFLKTKRTAGVLPHHKIFSTGLRRYSHNARTESGHHPNPVLFVLSLRSRFSRFALRSLAQRLIRSHALRPHEFAAEGQARADIRIRIRGIVTSTRIRDTAIRVRIVVPAIDTRPVAVLIQ